MSFNLHDNRIVATWQPDGVPLGIITGQLHVVTVGDERVPGFEVDWIIRFPESPARTGERMCLDLLPKLVAFYQLKWILVKIRDDYKPSSLAEMAQRFGFVYQGRQEPGVALWRKDIS